MVRYTLYTETKDNLRELTAKYFACATIQDNLTGIWHGKVELCTKIELIIDETNLYNDIKLETLVSDIKAVNEQESVMVIKDNPLVWWF